MTNSLWSVYFRVLTLGIKMIATAKELRYQVGELLNLVDHNEEVIITYRGKQRAKLVPITFNQEATENPILGMWKDRDDLEDVEKAVRKMRKGRSF